VRVRLVYRAFWSAAAKAKEWPDDAITIVDRTIDVTQP
jgi:hypothetical protein